MKTRIDWIDTAKGFGILLVIIAHIHHFSYIYSFHIPLFFILSGYTYKQYDSTFTEFTTKKIKTLIIPYFSLGLILVIFSSLTIHSDHSRMLIGVELLKNLVIQERFWTLWFLSALFILNVLFYWLIILFKEKIRYIAITAFALSCFVALYYKYGGQPLPWNIDASFMALPFFLFGYYAKKIDAKDSNRARFLKMGFAAIPLSILINVLLTYINIKATGATLEMWGSQYAIMPLTYISAVSGSLAVILVSKRTNIAALKYIGKHSMIFFAWHQTLAMPLINYFFHKVGIFQQQHLSIAMKFEKGALNFALVLFCMTFANEIINRMELKIFTGLK